MAVGQLDDIGIQPLPALYHYQELPGGQCDTAPAASCCQPKPPPAIQNILYS